MIIRNPTFGTPGLVPFKVESFDGKVLAFHIVIIQTNIELSSLLKILSESAKSQHPYNIVECTVLLVRVRTLILH